MSIQKFFWPFLIIIYTSVLLFNLTGLPLYLDEGIYIFWSYLFSADPSYAYVSMQDGKTPLFFWLTAYINQYFRYFIYSARFISVIASVVTLVCFLIIGLKTFDKKFSRILFALFLITPFNILISRLGFVDPLLTAFGSLSILMIFFIIRSNSGQVVKILSLSFLTGLFLGLAFLTKTTAKIFLAGELLVLTFFILQNLRLKRFRMSGILTLSALILAGVYFEISSYLRVGAYRFWGMISEKEGDLVFTIPEIFKNILTFQQFHLYSQNFINMLDYFFVYFNVLIIFFFIGIYQMFKTKKLRWLLFLLVFFTLGIFLSAKIIASRYFAIMIPEFIFISSIGLFSILSQKNQNFKIISLIVLLIPAFMSLKLVMTPINAFYPNNDRANFIEYDLNALGLDESVEIIEKENSAVGVTGIWGVSDGVYLRFLEKGFEVYQLNNLIEKKVLTEEVCEKDFILIEEDCFKANFGDLKNSSKLNKYLYINDSKVNIEILKKLGNTEIVKEFERPVSGLKVFLIRLLPDN